MIDLGNVCQDCVNAWVQIYMQAGGVQSSQDITYELVGPDDCEECEGEIAEYNASFEG